jgi:DNA-binding response OmpR family regulator
MSFDDLRNTPQYRIAMTSSPQSNPNQFSAGLPSDLVRALVVEDDPVLLKLLSHTLTDAGYQVTAVNNGRLALDHVLSTGTQVIVTDWVMPEMDGISLCRALRLSPVGRKCYVLMMSSFKADEKIIEAYEAGVDAYEVKPFNAKVLRARLLAARRALSRQ